MCSKAQADESDFIYDYSGNLVSSSLDGSFPAIRAQPQPQLVESNVPVTFSVVAAGPGLSYQWLSNGLPILGATGDSLLLTNYNLVSSTNFSVIISNASGMVTSTPAALWADSNGNGIPDWWEMKYFGNLNQTATGDFDGDGVDNLDEYLEGTNPNNASSFDPRLYLSGFHGTVVATPAQPYYTNEQIVTLTAIPDPGQEFIGWSGSVTGTKPTISLVMNSHKTITANFGLTLPTALNNSALVWATGGDASWFGQTETTEDGVGAAQSGRIYSSEQSWLQTETNLNQSMTLTFWWAVSSQPPDGLSFSIDGTQVASISGQTISWQLYQTNLPAGLHSLLWTYSKGAVDSPTSVPYVDAGWVGDVTISPVVTQSNAPSLSIALAGTNSVVLSWPAPSAGFVLQQNPNLMTSNWVKVTNPLTVLNGQNQIITIVSTNSQFYRLVNP